MVLKTVWKTLQMVYPVYTFGKNGEILYYCFWIIFSFQHQKCL